MTQLVYLPILFFPFFHLLHYPIHNSMLCAAAMLGALLLGIVIFFAKAAFSCVTAEFNLGAKLALLWVAGIQLVQFWVHFPGLVSPDDLNLLQTLDHGVISSWHSNSYSLLIQACQLIFGSAFCISIFNSLLLIFCFFLVLRIFTNKLNYGTLLCLAILFSMPQLAILGVYENRDSLNSLIILWFCCGLIAQRSSRNNEPWFHLLTLTMIALLLGDIRQDGKIFIFLFPIAISWLHRKNTKFLLRFSTGIYVASFALSWIPSHFLNLDSYSRDYLSTTYINPLNYIFHVKGISAATESEQKDINRFFHLDYLVNDYDPLDIRPFHRGGVRRPNTEVDFLAFQSAARSILFRNIPLVLENRWTLGKAMLNFEGYPAIYADGLRSNDSINPESKKFFSFSMKSKELSVSENLYFRLVDTIFYQLPNLLRVLISSCLIPFLATVFALFYARKKPELLFPSLLSLIRLSIILLLAPAAYFKYISSFWAIGWLLLVYICANHHKKSGNISIAA